MKKAGCEKIYKEQVSSVAERTELKNAIDFVREHDNFIVTKLDRLARSTAGLIKIIDQLDKKKVRLKILRTRIHGIRNVE